MKKKTNAGVIALFIVIALLAALCAAYCIYANVQYRTRFIDGTRINGIEAGGLTAEDVEGIIRQRVEDYEITLTFREGKEEKITGAEIDLRYASDDGVKKLLKQQNIYEWGFGKLGQAMSFTVGEAYTFNEELLTQVTEALPEFQKENVIQPQNAHMAIGTDHMMTIVPEVDGNAVRPSVVVKALKKAINAGKSKLDVSNLKNAYKSAKVRSDDEALNAQMNDLNSYLGITVTYYLYDGSAAPVDSSIISGWLSVKEDDPDYYYLNTDVLKTRCAEYISGLAAKYDKVTDSVTIHSTNRGDITMATGPRGYQIAQADETEALYNAILGRQSVDREPVYLLNNGFMTDLGPTYIEIDLQNQHVYFYRDGGLYIDTPCVTGTATDPERATPPGIFEITEKDVNRTLRGINYDTGEYTYESFVNYWMRFNEGIGLHDASWRSEFGGSIYQYSGSHGCVNLPYSAAAAIFNACELGMPVVVF